MLMRFLQRFVAAAFLLGGGASTGYAASVSLLPGHLDVFLEDGTATLELVMDFDGEPTVGGGLDFALTGPIAIVGFTPAAYFTDVAESVFSGFGTTFADADYEIHFGSFYGLSGSHKLGDITLSLLDVGEAAITLSINTRFEGFTSITAAQMAVDLNGATLTITRVPLPAAGWLLLTGCGWLAVRRLRGRTRNAPAMRA